MKSKNKRTGFSHKNQYEGLIFVSLWIAGFLIFRLFPLIFSLVCSFSDFRLFGGITKWGLMNYCEIFADSSIISSFLTTLKYTLLTVPLRILAALSAALLLGRNFRGSSFFRTAFYIPTVLGSSVAAAILWKAVFRDDGTANAFLEVLGFQPVSWLSGKNSAMFVISLLRIWQFGSSMMVFLAALNAVPGELYEAAELDGAGKTRKFFTVTLPFLTPSVFFNIVSQTGITLQEFNAPFIITQGGPRGSTTLISVLIYNTAFQLKDMGMACALTWVFFILIAVIVTAFFASQKFWVFYINDTGERK